VTLSGPTDSRVPMLREIRESQTQTQTDVHENSTLKKGRRSDEDDKPLEASLDLCTPFATYCTSFPLPKPKEKNMQYGKKRKRVHADFTQCPFG
jgi:hypothetical protein